MKLQEEIAQYNKEIGYERIAKVKGYSNPYATLDRQGVVVGTWIRKEIQNLIKCSN